MKKDDLRGLRIRLLLAMGFSSLFMMITGGIGLERTFSAYARINAMQFGIYGFCALALLAMGIILAVHSVRLWWRSRNRDRMFDGYEDYE